MAGRAEFKINEKFAQKYEKYRQKEELQRLKDRYGEQPEESQSSSSDSEEESDVELDPNIERDFYRTLSLLKKKDPKIYRKDATFYAAEASAASEDAQPSTSKTEKPMFLKDYERKVILEKGGKYEDEEDDSDGDPLKTCERAASPSYIQEQRELKESFQKFIQESDEDGDDEDSQLLRPRKKTQEEKDKEEADYTEWLKGQAELQERDEVQDMKYLRDFWNDPELDEKEKFLRDYILNKGYLEEDEDRIPTFDEVVQEEVEDSEEEGESFLEKQEDFERHYNFRFEEPDGHQIKTYPRTIATSVRSKDDRRKRKREEVKERKRKEKEQKREQLKQLKNLKRNEIVEKLRRLQELTGNKELAFSQVDLEGDFDPQQHDQLMQKFFGDEYYGQEEEEKPQFDEEDMDEHWNWDNWTGEGEGEEEGGDGLAEEEYDDYEPNCDDPDFIMDADYDPSQEPTSKKKKRNKEIAERKKKNMTKDDALLMGKKRKKSHFASVITKSKPVFDPQEKTFEQYLDEYYKLDYEDIIDDLPCRFRYRQVVPNDFGLTTEEILEADEKELNRWCSLKKTCMYRSEREEMSDQKNYKIKAQNEKKKREVLHSLYMEEDADNEQVAGKLKVGKKRRDRLKKKEAEREKEEAGDVGDETTGADLFKGNDVKSMMQSGAEDDDEEEFLVPKEKKVEDCVEAVVSEVKRGLPTDKTKWPKKKRRHPGRHLISGSIRVKMGGREFSGQRLKAYGLNPKKLRYKQLKRQKRKVEEKKERKKNLEGVS
ncbi:protein KRI1 homolog isoform X2 [Scleropages formosus]|uniref:Protein KRI1 homolog n=1 Tax=Scleropages formosus TaxID=113540 RepID=A0A8C9V4J5_SCLFO|nr:protein KRI1 homolog isoform X2 [Scleropages formosus]